MREGGWEARERWRAKERGRAGESVSTRGTVVYSFWKTVKVSKRAKSEDLVKDKTQAK